MDRAVKEGGSKEGGRSTGTHPTSAVPASPPTRCAPRHCPPPPSRFQFDDEGLEVLTGRGEDTENAFVGGKNKWAYDSFINWEFWWPDFPVLTYFKVGGGGTHAGQGTTHMGPCTCRWGTYRAGRGGRYLQGKIYGAMYTVHAGEGTCR